MLTYLTTAIAIACSLLATTASAEPVALKASRGPAPDPSTATSPAIVLEGHVGERSSALTEVIDPILDELDQRGFAARPASIIKLLGGRAPRPGILDGGKTAEDIVALSKSGFDAFTRAEYKDAAAALALAVRQIERNPALLVLDVTNARTTFQAFVGLALSQAKLGQASESVDTMTELLRTFSTQTISRAEYGPQAEQFYRAVQKQTEAMGRGSLTITVDDDRAVIFVNGELRGTGKASLADLIPGSYRVFIQVPGIGGRQYRVEIRADNHSKFDVNWPVDAALTISEPWVGFVFASEAERDRESAYASKLAHRWGLSTVVIVDTTRFHDNPAVLGTMYRADGDVVRSALVALRSDTTNLRSLGKFLADGTPSQDLIVVTSAVGRRHSGAHAFSAPNDRSVPAWPFLVGGAVAIGVGVGLLAIDQDHGHTDVHGIRTPYYWDTAPFGVAAEIAGAVSIGFAALWWTHTRHWSSTPHISVGASHVLLGLTRGF